MGETYVQIVPPDSSFTHNIITNNRILSNRGYGIHLHGSDTNYISQNDIIGNDTSFYFLWFSSGNVVVKNNIQELGEWSVLNHLASNLLSYNVSDTVKSYRYGFPQFLTRNYWGRTDEKAITTKLNDSVSIFRPYRLGLVDTAPGADTVAPRPPQNVSISKNQAGRT